MHTDYTSRCQKFDDMSDRDVVDAVIKNEEDAAFCLLHHKLIKLFKHLADVYSKLRYDAGDIANEMYVHLSGDDWRKLRLFEFRSSFFGWIKVVTNRYLLNEMEKISACVKCKNKETPTCLTCKKASIKDVLFFSCLIEREEENGYNPVESIPDPSQTHVLIDERLYDAYLVEELYKEIDSLSSHMREVIRLRYLVGLSSKETAEVLCKLGTSGKNITPSAVDQLCKRAKDTIREKISQRIGGI